MQSKGQKTYSQQIQVTEETGSGQISQEGDNNRGRPIWVNNTYQGAKRAKKEVSTNHTVMIKEEDPSLSTTERRVSEMEEKLKNAQIENAQLKERLQALEKLYKRNG